jgi:hypothetical protein
MLSFEDIIDSLINGQRKQALKQVDAFGWDDFADEMLRTDLLEDSTKVVYLCQLIKTNEEDKHL